MEGIRNNLASGCIIRCFNIPVRVKTYKKRQPDSPRQAHQVGLKQNEHGDIKSQPPEKPVVLQGETDQYRPGYKTGDRQRHRECIAYIAGAVIKTHFYFHPLSANRATITHFHELLQLVSAFALKHIPLPAAGTFMMYQAPQVTWLTLFFTGQGILLFVVCHNHKSQTCIVCIQLLQEGVLKRVLIKPITYL
jgi:hypothetical protein